MPFIRPTTLQLLHQRMESAMAQHDDGTIIQPWCHDRPGHPVGFSSHFFPALAQLQGDEGAKLVVQQAGQRLQKITVADDGVLLDIDRPD
jgi:molybdenum cofactor cytidylyltransferase